jgi:tetratricopeptide (TPR) repeat protein
MDNNSGAVFCYRKVVELEPNNIECWLDLGSTLLEMDNFNESLSAFETVISLSPEWSEGYYNKSKLFIKRNEISKSAHWLHLAILFEPKKAEEFERDFQDFADKTTITDLKSELNRLMSLKKK